MTRSIRFWLGSLVALLLVTNLIWMWWANRGLITIHADDEPFSKIVASVGRQGGVALATNVDAAAKVTLHFDKIPLTDALDRLAGAVDGRWNLTYLYAPTKTSLAEAVAAFKGGRLPESWRSFRVGVPDFLEDDGPPPDPRSLLASPQTPDEKTLHAYLGAFVLSTDVTASAPGDWNPPVNAPLKEGMTPAVAKTIAKASKSNFQEAFFVAVRPPREEGENRVAQGDGGNQEGPRRVWGEGRPQMNEPAIAKRIENQIAALPPGKQAEAKKDFADFRNFWEEVRALPEDQRRAKFEERMADPAVQDRMEKRENYRESRRSPEKRLQRYERYFERKTSMQNQGQ